MTTQSNESEKINSSLEDIKNLLRFLIALELQDRGATQDQIASKLKTSKSTVNTMLKGIASSKLPKD